MPRPPRVVADGVPYHVVQRGNHREPIFFNDLDRHRYLEILGRYAKRHQLRLLGYCLMPNHVHLVVMPNTPFALPRGIGEAHNLYSRWLNQRLGRVGHLWVRRYYAAPMDRSHLIAALRYVERNPMRARLTTCATDFPWSSARAHVSGLDNADLLDMNVWREEVHAHGYWAEILGSSRSDDALIDDIRRGTEAGNPVGSQQFQKEIARRTGRPWPTNRRGRPSHAFVEAAAIA